MGMVPNIIDVFFKYKLDTAMKNGSNVDIHNRITLINPWRARTARLTLLGS